MGNFQKHSHKKSCLLSERITFEATPSFVLIIYGYPALDILKCNGDVYYILTVFIYFHNNVVGKKFGNRYYTQHAVKRIKPSGMRYSSTTDVVVHASRIYEAGRGKYGRSISPNYVEVVINYGSESLPIYVNGSERVNYTSGSVTVVTEDHGRIIVTIITN